MTDLTPIIQGLTEAQRDAVLFWPRGFWGANTSRALLRKGLIYRGDLSETGLRVRAALKGEVHE
jgi:hypothetical protein